jgi:hypothetical protein
MLLVFRNVLPLLPGDVGGRRGPRRPRPQQQLRELPPCLRPRLHRHGRQARGPERRHLPDHPAAHLCNEVCERPWHRRRPRGGGHGARRGDGGGGAEIRDPPQPASVAPQAATRSPRWRAPLTTARSRRARRPAPAATQNPCARPRGSASSQVRRGAHRPAPPRPARQPRLTRSQTLRDRRRPQRRRRRALCTGRRPTGEQDGGSFEVWILQSARKEMAASGCDGDRLGPSRRRQAA